MRALILHGPGDVRLEDVPDPRPGAGEVVVATEYAMTCATDAKIMRNGRHPAIGPCPAPFGHEVTGRVAAVGAGVEWPREGDAVVIANSAPCGGCHQCRAGRVSLCEDLTYLWGAYAELVRVPARIVRANMLERPASLDPRMAAMVEPLACAIHGGARVQAGDDDTVVIVGGGVQGQFLTAQFAQRGCHVILCDPHEERRARARRFGAAVVHDAPRDGDGVAAVRALTPGGRGADVVVEAIGRPETWRVAVELAGRGAEVLLYGGCPLGSEVALPTAPLHYDELRIVGSYHHMPSAIRAALAMLVEPRVPFAELVGETIGLTEVAGVLATSGEKRPVRPRDAT